MSFVATLLFAFVCVDPCTSDILCTLPPDRAAKNTERHDTVTRAEPGIAAQPRHRVSASSHPISVI